jgi:hypothetical protein
MVSIQDRQGIVQIAKHRCQIGRNLFWDRGAVKDGSAGQGVTHRGGSFEKEEKKETPKSYTQDMGVFWPERQEKRVAGQ